MPARRRGLGPAGLRWQLAGWIAVVMLACLAVAFVAVYRDTGTQLRRQIDTELKGEAHGLLGSLRLGAGHTPAEVAQTAARYIRSQPFDTGSTVLFVEAPGERTQTNRPELFEALPPDDGETPAEQAHENALSLNILRSGSGYSTVTVADSEGLRVLKLQMRMASGPLVTVGAGESLSTVSEAQRGVARAFILGGVLAMLGALLAAYLIGTRLSRPLRRMAAVAARVDAGDLHPRIEHPGRQGEEVTVLADAFNHMLDRLTDAFAGQRAFVADASHELRTPLTVIRGQLEVLASQAEPPPEEVRRVERLVGAEIGRISRLVDDLLLLAKTEQGEFLRAEPIELREFVGELWDGMSLLADRSFELGPVAEGTLTADPDRVAQALRNLVANAIDHTAEGIGLVRLAAIALPGGRVRFLVEDDGPGIAPAQRDLIFDRFYRTDSARSRWRGGTGLGLAIVRAIARAHGGEVSAGSSPEGGARIELELPGFRAEPGSPIGGGAVVPSGARAGGAPAGS
jgi:signal transduction histidine kinase